MKLFSFNGRAGRVNYLSNLIFFLILAAFINQINSESMLNDYKPSPVVIFMIPLYWILWAQGSKRCHDIGVSGWMQIIPFYFLWMLVKKGDFGENKYGLAPNTK